MYLYHDLQYIFPVLSCSCLVSFLGFVSSKLFAHTRYDIENILLELVQFK
jgi:hypothetical protein